MTNPFAALLTPIRSRPGDPQPDRNPHYRKMAAILAPPGTRVHILRDDDLDPLTDEHGRPTRHARRTAAAGLYHPLQPGQKRRRRVKAAPAEPSGAADRQMPNQDATSAGASASAVLCEVVRAPGADRARP